MEMRSITRKEVEEKLAISGDFVKMDFLQRCLKMNIDFDTKRFVMIKLSSIYESRQMYLEAAKLIRNVADINTTFEGKYNDFTKALELFIKASDYDEAELTFKKALTCASAKQKDVLRAKMKDSYRTKANEMLKKDKRKNAMDAWERFLELPFINEAERSEAQAALSTLYHKLGKIREYTAIKRAIANPEPIKPVVEEKKYDDFNIDDLLR